MKRILLLLFSTFLCLLVFAQKQSDFIGGNEATAKEIAENITGNPIVSIDKGNNLLIFDFKNESVYLKKFESDYVLFQIIGSFDDLFSIWKKLIDSSATALQIKEQIKLRPAKKQIILDSGQKLTYVFFEGENKWIISRYGI